MLSINLKRSAVALAVTTGLLVAAGPASAIVYNGHAGLGSNAISDGTSNTVQFAHTTSPKNVATDGIGAWIP